MAAWGEKFSYLALSGGRKSSQARPCMEQAVETLQHAAASPTARSNNSRWSRAGLALVRLLVTGMSLGADVGVSLESVRHCCWSQSASVAGVSAAVAGVGEPLSLELVRHCRWSWCTAVVGVGALLSLELVRHCHWSQSAAVANPAINRSHHTLDPQYLVPCVLDCPHCVPPSSPSSKKLWEKKPP